MSFLQFLRILFARRSILLAALLGSVLVAAIMTQILPYRYESKARIMLDIVKPDPVTGQVMSNQFLRAYVRTQIELIRDYQVAGVVVDKLGWANDPATIDAYDTVTNGKGSDIRRWLAQQIIDGTSANVIEASNILEITYQSTSPDAAARIVELVRETYIDESLQYRREAAGRTAEWYKDQAEKAKTVLAAAESARSKYARENGIVLQGDRDIESAKLEALTGQSVAATTAPGLPQISMPAAVAAAPSNVALDQINQQIAQAATTLGPNHPTFQALQRQKSVIEAETARQRTLARSVQVPQINMPKSNVEAAYEQQKGRVLAQRDKIDTIGQLSRDIEVKRDQYLKAAQRAADLQLQADVGETGLTPMGSPITPSKASFPNVPLIMFGSTGFGSALGICLSLLIELLGRRVRSDEDLEYASKAPVFATIGLPDNSHTWYRRAAHWLVEKISARRKRLAEAV